MMRGGTKAAGQEGMYIATAGGLCQSLPSATAPVPNQVRAAPVARASQPLLLHAPDSDSGDRVVTFSGQDLGGTIEVDPSLS